MFVDRTVAEEADVLVRKVVGETNVFREESWKGRK